VVAEIVIYKYSFLTNTSQEYLNGQEKRRFTLLNIKRKAEINPDSYLEISDRPRSIATGNMNANWHYAVSIGKNCQLSMACWLLKCCQFCT